MVVNGDQNVSKTQNRKSKTSSLFCIFRFFEKITQKNFYFCFCFFFHHEKENSKSSSKILKILPTPTKTSFTFSKFTTFISSFQITIEKTATTIHSGEFYRHVSGDNSKWKSWNSSRIRISISIHTSNSTTRSSSTLLTCASVTRSIVFEFEDFQQNSKNEFEISWRICDNDNTSGLESMLTFVYDKKKQFEHVFLVESNFRKYLSFFVFSRIFFDLRSHLTTWNHDRFWTTKTTTLSFRSNNFTTNSLHSTTKLCACLTDFEFKHFN